jgi:hypothetical protein
MIEITIPITPIIGILLFALPSVVVLTIINYAIKKDYNMVFSLIMIFICVDFVYAIITPALHQGLCTDIEICQNMQLAHYLETQPIQPLHWIMQGCQQIGSMINIQVI